MPSQSDPRIEKFDTDLSKLRDDTNRHDLRLVRMETKLDGLDEKIEALDSKLDRILPTVEMARDVINTWGTFKKFGWVVFGAFASGVVSLAVKFLL